MRLEFAGKRHERRIRNAILNGSRKTTEITPWLEVHRTAIESGELVVLCQDECHLWGDVTGYEWGKSSERIEIPLTNIRDKQTYYGAIDLATKRCLLVFPYPSR